MMTVVIPAYNEEKNISACLQSLVTQVTSHNFNVIVVDNNSSDQTTKKVLAFKNTLDIIVITEKKKGRGIARNTGFAAVKNEIILSTDADTILPEDWIETLYTQLTKNDAVAVTGTCKIIDCKRYTNVLFNVFQPVAMHIYRLLFGHYWLSGFNFAIYKKAYSQTSGFDITLNAQEDIDLSFKVNKIGKIHFCKNIPVIFSGRRFQKGLFQGCFQYLKSFTDWYIFKRKTTNLSDVR